MKDHEIAQFVNDLTDIAKTFGQTQQLREHIRSTVLAHLNTRPDGWIPVSELPEGKY